MASSTNKYAGLPDIDLDQQDVYETADVPEDDVSTVPTSLSDEDDADIERAGLSMDAARQRFAGERVDADNADFSDTLIAKQRKQAYRTSRDDISRTETLEEKMARIKREMEEVRIQMVTDKKPDDEIQEWERLISSVSTEDNAIKSLTSRVQNLTTTQPPSSQKTTYTLTYNPTDTINISTLSTRLSTLESLLGLPLTTQTTPLLPTLSHLSSKLTLLTSQSAIDSLTTRLKSLTQHLTTLEEKREQARQRALLDTEDSPPLPVDESDMNRKVDALYASLEGIERVLPVVPGLLERLRGMARVHADAGSVTGGLKEVLDRLGRMEKEVESWREALGSVESGLKESAGRVGGVAERIEQVVSGLESRINKLDSH